MRLSRNRRTQRLSGQACEPVRLRHDAVARRRPFARPIPREESGPPRWVLAAHEYDGLIDAGLALPAPQSGDPLEREAEMAEDKREQLVGGERVAEELAIADDVCQAAAPAADASEAAGMFKEIAKVLIDVRAHQLPAGSDFL